MFIQTRSKRNLDIRINLLLFFCPSIIRIFNRSNLNIPMNNIKIIIKQIYPSIICIFWKIISRIIQNFFSITRKLLSRITCPSVYLSIIDLIIMLCIKTMCFPSIKSSQLKHLNRISCRKFPFQIFKDL